MFLIWGTGFILILIVCSWHSGNKERERGEQELKQAKDPVELYYVKRKQAISRQKRESSIWRSPECPRCGAIDAMFDMDTLPLEMRIPEEERWVKANPGKKDSPMAQAKYMCKYCQRMW